jgi:hypothetical protein
MGWWDGTSCEAVATTGWMIGTYSGLFVDIVFVALAASARPYRAGLSASRARGLLQWALQRSLLALPFVWIGLGWWLGFAACYATKLALGMAASTLVPVLLVMATAAQQIGERGVR